MRQFQAIIVLADISGYTKFVVANRNSILHAELIITELMETVTENAAVPLILQKLEGDAAFFIAEIRNSRREAINDVMRQVVIFMKLFREKQRVLFEISVGGCPCAACQAVEKLNLKCIVHTGAVLEKKVGAHFEIAGEPVIVAHKLMKNSVRANAYILVTEAVEKELERAPYPQRESLLEEVEDIGTVPITAYLAQEPSFHRNDIEPLTRFTGILEAMRMMWRGMYLRTQKTKLKFRNLPF